MTEEVKEVHWVSGDTEQAPVAVDQACCPKAKLRAKRDIIRFNGAVPTAINLDHATTIYMDGKRITFEFYTKAQFIDFDDEDSAKRAFDIIMNTWASEMEMSVFY